ncbi:hypothetical protein LA52FAK_14050 [Desulforhopalus sp. 52FAK]
MATGYFVPGPVRTFALSVVTDKYFAAYAEVAQNKATELIAMIFFI